MSFPNKACSSEQKQINQTLKQCNNIIQKEIKT
jgi:hypothetical protein